MGRRLAVAVLVVGTALGATVLPAGAVPEPVSASVDGSFTTPVGSIPLGATIFEGTFDGDTGALEGQFIFPPTNIDVTSPAVATIGLQLQQPSVSTGSIDLATNVATFNTTLVLALQTVDAGGSGPFSIAPCNYSSAVQLTGTFDPATGVVSFEDADISLAAVADPNRCFYEITNGSIASIIDPVVTGPGSAFEASFNVQDASAVAPPQGVLLLEKTVGTTPDECATESNITVSAGTTVYYCYTMINDTDTTFVSHSLEDDQLGAVLTDEELDLAAGEFTDVIVETTIDATTTNTATWTATTDQDVSLEASGTATVTVGVPGGGAAEPVPAQPGFTG